MKVRIKRLELIGTNRVIQFEPGLNIITGPIATGKTTTIRLLRFFLGGALGNLPSEAREAVVAVSGTLLLKDTYYSVVRPAVTTLNARVEIASDSNTWRLPATSPMNGESYLHWLLDRLDLPRLEVPSAPTKVESEPTPVTINDYYLYSYLSQSELGFSVFGHKHPFKNIKRKNVFDISMGFTM